MLKHTNVLSELMSHIEMYDMIKNNIRGDYVQLGQLDMQKQIILI